VRLGASFRRIEQSQVLSVGYDPAMRNRAGEMTPQMMVLAATTAGPGTVREIQKRLVERWPSADFRKNSAHNNLPLLEEQGCVRLVEQGEKPSQDIYAIADMGWAALRTWVTRWPPDPANRDAIHVKVQFARLDDLPEIVRMVRAQESLCQEESDKAQARLLAAERLLSKRPPRNWEEELDAELKKAELEDVTLFWGDIAIRRKAYGDQVEDSYRRFSARARLAGEED
jgi:DNA-binding PadR family transcriptional regulator